MSADNTIVILINKKDNKIEYRVAHIQAAENITYNPEVEDGFNEEHVINLFGGCNVITDEVEAWKEAFRLETKARFVEYGIVKYDFSHFCFPKTQLAA